jgi:hypothetical protein
LLSALSLRPSNIYVLDFGLSVQMKLRLSLVLNYKLASSTLFVILSLQGFQGKTGWSPSNSISWERTIKKIPFGIFVILTNKLDRLSLADSSILVLHVKVRLGAYCCLCSTRLTHRGLFHLQAPNALAYYCMMCKLRQEIL